MDASYKQRPLGNAILQCARPVAIIEGARAVGKTSLTKNQIVPAGFQYINLSDPDVLREATSHPGEWFTFLPRPIIIDEAQLLPELPLLVKEALDQEISTQTQYVLTGSASIKAEGFGGQDPLIRRSETFKLDPFTEREIQGNLQNLVDDLWEAEPNEDFSQPLSRGELFARMQIGGFPLTVLSAPYTPQDTRVRQTYSDIERILSRDVVPHQRIDSGSAKALLHRLLTMPGGILNVSALSKDLGVTRPTIQNYLERLQDRFLIYPLRNLRLQAHRQTSSQAKIHPIDTAFSVCFFTMAGRDIRDDSTAFGRLFESYVVNQIVPAQSWSQRLSAAFYWRSVRKPYYEVDLVLVSNDEVLGIEVKSSAHIGPGDFAGLKALAATRKLARGYVVYTGEHIQRFGENLWALPVSALWSDNALTRPFKPQPKPMNTYVSKSNGGSSYLSGNSNLASAANLFLSYNHADNDYLDDAFIKLMHAIVKRYEFENSATLSTFIDKDNIPWGADWHNTLNTALGKTNFLMPQITPRYLSSAACRDELFKFEELNKDNAANAILPLIWQPINEDNLLPVERNAWNIVRQHQGYDVSALQDLEPSNPTYKATVKKLVKALEEILRDNAAKVDERAQPATESEESSTVYEANGIIEDYERVQEKLLEFDRLCLQAKTLTGNIGKAMSSLPQPDPQDPSSFKRWTQELESSTQPSVSQLNTCVQSLDGLWSSIFRYTERYIDFMKRTGNAQQLDTLLPSLNAMRSSFVLPPELKGQIEQFKVFQLLTPRFTPIVDAFSSCLDLFSTADAGADTLIGEINEANHRTHY